MQPLCPSINQLCLKIIIASSPQDFNLPLAVALGACSFEAYNLPYHMYGIKVPCPSIFLLQKFTKNDLFHGKSCVHARLQLHVETLHMSVLVSHVRLSHKDLRPSWKMPSDTREALMRASGGNWQCCSSACLSLMPDWLTSGPSSLIPEKETIE